MMKKNKSLKWTYEALKASANQYKVLKEWRINQPSAYAIACQKKILPELTKHMKSARYNYWNKERCHQFALQYDTKVDWIKGHSKSYYAASRLKIINQVTDHMTPIGNKKMRCLYAITVNKTSYAYIGLTGNFKRRMRDHLKTKRFTELAKEYGSGSIVFNQLTDYIDAEEAQRKEAELMDDYLINGFFLLNKSKAGSLGGSTLKWTEDAILEDAKKYTKVMDWVNAPKSGYPAASANGILDKATAHMEREIKTPGSWTKAEVIKYSSQFTTITEWNKEDKKSYAAAQRMGLLDDPDVVGHFTKGLVINKKWTKEKVLADAKNYSSRSEWKKNSASAYRASRNDDYLDEAVAHMKTPEKTRKWTKNKILIDAKKYKSRSEWNRHNPSAVSAARRLGCFDIAVNHMKILNPKGKWSKKSSVLTSAKKYKSKSEWQQHEVGAYGSAKNNGWFEEATAHMKRPKAT
jgi:predicted GIY-YIG superfamily endonuclease